MKQNIQIFIKCGEDSTDNLVKVNGRVSADSRV